MYGRLEWVGVMVVVGRVAGGKEGGIGVGCVVMGGGVCGGNGRRKEGGRGQLTELSHAIPSLWLGSSLSQN